MKKNLALFLSLFFFGVLAPQNLVLAQSSDALAQANNYNVTPGFSPSQRKETLNFYDLLLSPGASETFSLTINNKANHPQTFQVAVNNATTNRNGIVDYTQSHFTKDPSMTLALQDLVKIDSPQVTIGAHQSQTVHFQLTLPKKVFKGILLGGVVVRPVQEKQKGQGIQNVFLHTLAIRVAESDQALPSQILGGGVTLGQENLHNQVSMALRNPQPKLMSQLEGHFTITEKGEKTPLIDLKKKDLSIAPNSAFSLPVALKDHFKAGDYTYTLILKNQTEDWEFSKDFTIKAAKAKKYNRTSVDSTGSSLPKRWFYLGGGLMLVLLLVPFYLLGRRNAQRKKE